MSLINIEKTIELDVYDHDTTPSVIKAIQMDEGTRTVYALIQNSRQTYDIGQNASVSLTVLRPDNTRVQIVGQTFSYNGTESTIYGAKAELSDVALAVKGNLKAQFKITSGEQELRTEIFAINNGEALDAGDGDWAGDLDGHNLDEMAQDIEDAKTAVAEMETDVSELKSGLKHQINSEIIEFTEGGYIVTNGSTVDTSDIIENSDWACAIVDCNGGDYFSIKCYGGDSPRAYAIINNDGDVIEKSSPGIVTESLVIPDGATKIVLNTQTAYPSLSYKGEPIPNILFNMISDSADATGVLPITTAKRGFISIGTIAIGSLVSLSAVYYPNCTYSVIDCNEGDLFIVNGTGASNGRLYGILDANNLLLKKSVKNLKAKDLVVEIPPNGRKFIINHVGDSDTCFRISDTMAMANYKNGFKTNKVRAQKYTYAITGSTSSYQIVFNSSYVGFVAPVEPNTYYYIRNPGGNRFRIGSSSFDPLSLDFTSKNGDGLTIADDSASYLVFKTLSTDRYITVYCSSSSENINDISISRGIYQNNNTEITNYVLKSKYTIGYSLFDNGALYNSNDTYSNKWDSTDISDLYNIYDGLVSDFPGYVSKELFCTDTAGNNTYIYHFTNKEYATLGPANIKGKNKKIFIICGTHGYERMPMFSTAKLFDKICRNWESDPALEMLRWNIDFDVIPCLNVYGYINGTRKNENGIDLNRNYSEGWDKATSSIYTDPNSANYKGTTPFSEVQTSAVKNYFLANYSDIIFAIDFHYSSGFSYVAVQQEAIPLFASWKRLCDIWLMKLNEFSLISSDRNYVAIKNFYDLGSTAYWLNTLDVPSVLLESCGNIGTTNSGKDTEDFATTTLSNLILSRLRID